MLIKLIYEDPALATIKEDISKLDTKQLYFLERFLLKEKTQRKQQIFHQWQLFLVNNVENYSIK